MLLFPAPYNLGIQCACYASLRLIILIQSLGVVSCMLALLNEEPLPYNRAHRGQPSVA
jgi:hypothetical protein